MHCNYSVAILIMNNMRMAKENVRDFNAFALRSCAICDHFFFFFLFFKSKLLRWSAEWVAMQTLSFVKRNHKEGTIESEKVFETIRYASMVTKFKHSRLRCTLHIMVYASQCASTRALHRLKSKQWPHWWALHYRHDTKSVRSITFLMNIKET